MEQLIKRLNNIAWKKSKPFCYGCYKEAPTGTCKFCHSDDLMRLIPGVGCEWGIDWCIKHFVEENVEAIDTATAFEDSVSECYPEEVKIGWITYDVARAIKELDPVSWRMAESEWVDQQVEDQSLITLDNGGTHYWVHEVEQYLDQAEGETEAAG